MAFCCLKSICFSVVLPQTRRTNVSTLGDSQWITLLTSPRLSTSLNAYFSRSVLLAVCFLFSSFVACFDVLANVTIYCWGLFDGHGTGAVYDYQFATAENGGLGGYDGNVKLWPFLADYRSAAYSQGYTFWPRGYSSSGSAPVAYSPKRVPANDIVVSDDHTNRLNDIVNTLKSYGDEEWAQRSALSGVTVSYESDGTPVVNITTKNVGTYAGGGGVVTLDENGKPRVSYSDSSGYVPGYTYNPAGGYSPVWYDVSGGTPVELSSLRDVSSNALSYDSETGLYSFQQADYSPQLAEIGQTLRDIKGKETTVRIDNIDLAVPAPEVTVNVDPVVVPAPEVTVNVQPQVTAPDVNVEVSPPEVNVNLDTSEIEDALNGIASDVSDLSDALESRATDDFDLSPVGYSCEEQELFALQQGWNTQIPLISNAVDCAFDTFLGTIPDPGRDLHPISGLTFLGYEIDIDFRPYENLFLPFRAFLLMLEVVWFVNAVWKTVNQSQQV